MPSILLLVRRGSCEIYIDKYKISMTMTSVERDTIGSIGSISVTAAQTGHTVRLGVIVGGLLARAAVHVMGGDKQVRVALMAMG